MNYDEETADIAYRLDRLETLVARGGVLHRLAHSISGIWNEALHPRGRDGRFIETDGFVSGSFDFQVRKPDGSIGFDTRKVDRAQVVGFRSEGASKEDPWVLVKFTDEKGNALQGVARASEVTTAASVKARLTEDQRYSRDVGRIEKSRKKANDLLNLSGSFDPMMGEKGKYRRLRLKGLSHEEAYAQVTGKKGAPNPDVPEAGAPDLLATNSTTAAVVETLRKPGDAIPVNDVDEAMRLLLDGKKVELQQPDQVSTLLSELKRTVDEARASGENAPNVDLCNVTVKGANLFCVDNVGRDRIQMPQLSGVPVPGSKADALPRNKTGNVDIAPEFRKHLEAQGVMLTRRKVQASHLRASQSELNGVLVANLAQAMEDGTFTDSGSPMFISSDNYIVDGHHRWAATVGVSLGANEDLPIDTLQVNMPILDLLVEADNFAKEWGVPRVDKTDTGPNVPNVPNVDAPNADLKVDSADTADVVNAPLTDLTTPNVDERGFDTVPGDRGIMRAEQVRALTPDEVRSYVNNMTAGLSNDSADTRAAQLDAVLGSTFLSPMDTDNVHDKLGPDGDQWTAERSALHEKMWSDLLGQIETAGIPQDRDALVLGGLPGAGKSSSLLPGGPAERFGVVAWDPGDAPTPPDGVTHVSINPDSIKEMLIDVDGLPDGLSNIKPMEAVTFIHEESSFLSKEFLRRLQERGYNVVLDNTMETKKGMLKRMAPLASEGYKFRGLFVDITPEESKLSARTRYAMSFKSDRGGRFVSSAVQGDRTALNGRMSSNRNAFDELAGINPDNTVTGTGWFQDFIVVDNTGVANQTPLKEVTLTGSGDGSPAQEFLPEGLTLV